MRIAQVAPVAEAVPPERYGGTERVVSWLTEELVRRGHDVTLFAAGSSRTSATLVPVVPCALRQGDQRYDTVRWQPVEEALVQERAADFDIIHAHIDEFALAMLSRGVSTPVVTTLHGRLDRDDVQQLLANDRMAAVSISFAQRDPVPSAWWAANVYHGLPLDRYQPGPGDGDYVVFLGRISPEKRPHVAIDIARRAGVRLVCDDDDALVDAINQVGRINRAECRQWMETHFSVERMTADYERLFESLATDHTDSQSVTAAPTPQAA